jgi:papain like protease
MDKPVIRVGNTEQVLDVRPDPLDFRDRMYEPTLVYVPPERSLGTYLTGHISPPAILNQQSEGACTGFGLAAVANYLLATSVPANSSVVPNPRAPVSERMLYEMARRYDDTPGEEYSGSTLRGAMKGWHKHGVCTSGKWPYVPGKNDNVLSTDRAKEARLRPLGAYYRVNHRDLVSLHAAITEVGSLYAGARVHTGWQHVKKDGLIVQEDELIGGHAFAIVAYDSSGFWIQNSWGDKWGMGGFCKISYDDWLENGLDVWVARLAVPVVLEDSASTAILQAATTLSASSDSHHELRPHIISVGNDGLLRNTGPFATNEKEVESIFANDVRATLKSWTPGARRILLYAHGGLVGEPAAIQRVAEYRSTLLQNQIYPISFIWKTDYWTTVKNIIEDAFSRRRPEGILDAAKDFLLDRADDALEPLARTLSGRKVWDEMKENAKRASKGKGGARKVAIEIAKLLADPNFADVEVHVAGHSAGSIFLGPLVKLLASAQVQPVGVSGFGIPIKTCTLWAPAITISDFAADYGPVLGNIGSMAIFTLTDRAEQDDHCAKIYHKSLLYLVSHAFEAVPHVPLLSPGTPILGMQTWLEKWIGHVSNPKSKQHDPAIAKHLGRIERVLSPNTDAPSTGKGSTASHHGDFDDDDATVKSTLARILGVSAATTTALTAAKFSIQRTASSRRDRRLQFEAVV